MKAGDIVTIYADPLTEERPIDEAKLLKLEIENMGIWEGRTLQYWEVEGKSPEGRDFLSHAKILAPK